MGPYIHVRVFGCWRLILHRWEIKLNIALGEGCGENCRLSGEPAVLFICSLGRPVFTLAALGDGVGRKQKSAN